MGEPVIEEREIRISDKPIKSRGELTTLAADKRRMRFHNDSDF